MRQNAEKESTSGAVAEPLHPNKVRVLLIDGSSNAVPALRNGTRWGSLEPFEVTRKRTLAEGLDALQSSVFQIVLLDFSPSSSASIESLSETLRVAKGLPVIVLISEADTTKVSEALRLGARDYVLKGCECDCMVRAIKYAIERNQLLAAIEDGRSLITKDREEIVARGSHALRNALACIHQFGNILLDGLAGPISEEQREYVGIMVQNASRIRSVVADLMDAVPANGAEYTDETTHVSSINGVN